MIKRSTLILVVIFLLALSGYLLLNRQQEQAAAQVTPTLAAQPLFAFSADEITGLQLADAGGRQVRLEKMAGEWTLIDPAVEATDNEAAASLASQVASLTARSFLETAPAADTLSAFGLQPPAYTLEIRLADGSSHSAEIGAETPTKSGYYVRLSDARVAVVNTFSVNSITAALDNPPVYLTPTVGLTPLGPEMLPTSGGATTPTP